MNDQAENLRSIVEQRNQNENPNQSASGQGARVITVTSGKGGVGKTNFTINLAISLAKQNKRVFILDADFGLANVELLFGIIPRYNLSNVFNEDMDIEDIATDGPMGIKFISGGSGLKELANITNKQMAYIIEKFSYLDKVSDIILIDTGAGLDNAVLNFVKASNETIILTTPEPTSITDAYAIVKAISEENIEMPELKVVVNMAEDHNEGLEVFEKMNKVSTRFLNIELKSLGYLPRDNNLIRAVKKQQPVVISYPNSEISRGIENISKAILTSSSTVMPETRGIKNFMRRLAGVFK